MIAVADSSPIIVLAKARRLLLLRDLFTEVLVPQAVHREITAGGNRPGAQGLASEPWLRLRSVENEAEVRGLRSRLNWGEAEAIVLTQEIPGPVTVLLDDATARRLAEARGLLVVGTGGVVAQAKERGLIPAVLPVLDELRVAGLYLGDAVYHQLLFRAGEGS